MGYEITKGSTPARREEIEFYSQISESKILANCTTTRPPTKNQHTHNLPWEVDVQWPVKKKTKPALLDLLVYILFGRPPARLPGVISSGFVHLHELPPEALYELL